MSTEIWVFWICFGIVFYTFFGYGLFMFLLYQIKKLFFQHSRIPSEMFYPEVTLLIIAYNESAIIKDKMDNISTLCYPEHLLKIVWVIDGSNDGSFHLLKEYKNVTILYEKERKGKTHALNRAASFISTPYVVFTDADTFMSEKSIELLMQPMVKSEVGCVAGEKRIFKTLDTTGKGEGLYWKYESMLKRMDADINTAIGAAGELYAIRTELYQPIEENSLLDDFSLSMNILKQGYKIAYVPDAYAIEKPTINTKEEFKRKVRICAGGIQSIIKFRTFFNIFKFGFTSFQFISHRVLRWTATPFCLLFCYISNLFICINTTDGIIDIYSILFFFQSLFYLFAFGGYLMEQQNKYNRFFAVAFYFVFMNVSVVAGIVKYLKRKQDVLWAKAEKQN